MVGGWLRSTTTTMKHSPEFVGQRPAWLTIPQPVPTSDLFRAILGYQQAEAEFEAKDATFKRTKAGRIKDADIEGYKAVERERYLAAKDHAKVILDFKHEWFGDTYRVFVKNLLEAFLAFGLDGHEMQTTAVFTAIEEKYGADDFFTDNFCRVNYIKITHGSITSAIRVEINRRLESISLDEVLSNGTIKGSMWSRVKAKLAYRAWTDERDSEPYLAQVETGQEEMCPVAARDFAAILHEMSWIADGIAQFNEKHHKAVYRYDADRDNVLIDAIGYDITEVSTPDNPDEA
jgi:hypothetical protein